MKTFKIVDRVIGEESKPFIIAEMSGNHNHSLDRALQLVKAAADSGADALKLQTYTADTITLNQTGGLFDINDENSLWKGKNLYDLYNEAHTPWEWHKEIFDYAKSLGMIAFSSPFDESSVDFLESLDVPLYKIASFESAHHPLLKKVAKTGKPVIISSGASTLDELHESVNILRINGCNHITVLKCTSTYPASAENSNIVTIPVLKSVFNDCIIGLSDHTMGVGVSVASVALGARVIEKHFTLSRADGGVDSDFSLEPQELRSLVDECERAFLALGEVQLNTQKAEEKSRQFKRSIYVSSDLNKGDTLSEDNIRVIRPGDGIEPKYYELLLGKTVKENVKFGTPLTWDKLL